MFEFLDKLRTKPPHVRRFIALGTTLAIFFVIVNIWWETSKTPQTENPVTITDVVSPLQVVANAFMSAKHSISEYGKDLNAKFSNATVTPELRADSFVPPAKFVPKPGDQDIVYPDQIFKNTYPNTEQTPPDDKLSATTTTSTTNN